MKTFAIQDVRTGKYFYRESPSHYGFWVDSVLDANKFASAESASTFAHDVICLIPGTYAIVPVL